MGYDVSTKDIVFSTRNAGYSPDLIVNRDSGFVGLNTKTPKERLHVLGDELLEGDLKFKTGQQNIIFAIPSVPNVSMMDMSSTTSVHGTRMVLARASNASTTGLQYDFTSDVFSFMKNGVGKLRIDLTNGRLGINQNAPAYPLDVNGYTRIAGNLGVQTAPNSRTIQVGSTQGSLIGIGTAEYIQDAGTSSLSTNSSWLPVTNNLYSLGNSTFRWKDVWAVDGTINTSDARDKTNDNDLQYGLKEIMQLRTVKFSWRSNPAEGDKLGVIAQEIQKVLPEVVRDWQYQNDEQTGKQTKVAADRMGVMYADIIPVLIHGMQEQQKEMRN